MSDQLTQCPHCQISFRVTPAQLRAAGGLVRCGSCLGLFSAAINFIRVKPDPDAADPPRDHRGFVASDDILLGDLDLDSLPLMEQEPADFDVTGATAAMLEPEDDTEPGQESAADLLLSDPVFPRQEPPDDYEVYEEYEDGPDLLANLATPPPARDAADADQDFHLIGDPEAEPAAEETVAAEPAAVSQDDADWRDGPSEEFRPRTILFDDDDEDEDEDERRDGAEIDEYDEPESIPAAISAAPGRRDPAFDRDEPTLGELDANEFDSPEPGELELDEPAADSAGTASTATATRGKPEWLLRKDPLPPEKAVLHDYLATLQDEDELEPLGSAQLEDLDEEPVLLAAGSRKRSLLATTGLLLLSLLLMGTLLLQFVEQHLEALRQRNSFARFEPWFCLILDCPQPVAPVTAGPGLSSQELLIRSHPRLQGALELSFIFRNDAAEAQPFPGLELSFKDASDRLLANRLLLPADYLPPELRPLSAMPGRSSVQVMLELVDPGVEAVNYLIEFRDL